MLIKLTRECWRRRRRQSAVFTKIAAMACHCITNAELFSGLREKLSRHKPFCSSFLHLTRDICPKFLVLIYLITMVVLELLNILPDQQVLKIMSLDSSMDRS